MAMWKISKVKIHRTHCCEQIAFATDLHSILRAWADKISLKPLTQFWITGSHERVSCFPSLSHLYKKYWEWDGIILLKFLFCGSECVRWHITFFVPFFKLWYISRSLTTECFKDPFLYPRSSVCAIFLKINAAQSVVANKDHNIKKFGRHKFQVAWSLK